MRDLFGASVTFSIDFDDGDNIRPDHDIETCDCCGEEKNTIINIPFDFFTTKDGNIYTEPTNDTLWRTDGKVRNDQFITNIPHLSISTLEDAGYGGENIFRQLLTLMEEILQEIDASQEYTADVSGIDSGSLDYDLDDAMDAGLSLRSVGVTHPILPSQVRVCDEHGLKFTGTYSDTELERCCDDAVITYETDPDDLQPADMNTRIKQQLRKAVSEHRTQLQNPYDKSGIIPTEALIPFLYKHGADGVTVWNALHDHLFAETDAAPHPVLGGLPDDTMDTIEQADISKAEYVEIAYDLFRTLRWGCPLTASAEQTRMLEEQFPELYQITVTNQSVWETITPIWGDVLTNDEIEALSETGTLRTTYRDAYRGGVTYQYDENALAETLNQNNTDLGYIIIPADVYHNAYGSLDNDTDQFSVVCAVDKTGYVPYIDEQYVEDDANLMLPRAVWVTPQFIVLDEDAEVSLSTLQSASRDIGGKLDTEPITDTVLQAASAVTGNVPTDLGPQPASTLQQVTFDQDDLNDSDTTTTLGSHVEAIGDVAPAEERHTIVTPYDRAYGAVEIDGEEWQTGIAVSQYPIVHGDIQDESVLEQGDYFVDFSLNIHSPDDIDRDSLFYSPKVQWDTILPDDFDAAETENPEEVIEEYVQTSEYDFDDKLYLFEIQAPITTINNIKTDEINL